MALGYVGIPALIKRSLLITFTLEGYIGSMSIGAIPAVSKAPPSIAPKQWRTIYDIGVASAPKIALAASSAFAYAAYVARQSNLTGNNIAASRMTFTNFNPVLLLSVAAVTPILIAPWTIVTMRPTNDALDAKLAIADSRGEVKQDEEIQRLLHRWGVLNGIRAVFPLVGALSGLLAVLV